MVKNNIKYLASVHIYMHYSIVDWTNKAFFEQLQVKMKPECLPTHEIQEDAPFKNCINSDNWVLCISADSCSFQLYNLSFQVD